LQHICTDTNQVATEHYVFEDLVPHARGANEPSFITLIKGSLPKALLATCHQIQEEASTAFESLVSDLKREPVRFIIDYESMDTFDHNFGILYHIYYSINCETEGRDYTKILSKRSNELLDVQLHVRTPAHTALLTLVERCRHALTHAKSIIIAIDMRRPTISPHPNGIFSGFLSLVSRRLSRMLGKATRIAFVLRPKDEYWPAGSRIYTWLCKGLQNNARRLADGQVVHEMQRRLTDEAWKGDWVAHNV
jgi:hypothetical protein